VRQSNALQFQERFRQQHQRAMELVLAGLGKWQLDATLCSRAQDDDRRCDGGARGAELRTRRP
jgi:hypothetical protein